MKMKKIYAVGLVLTLIVAVFAGCAPTQNQAQPETQSQPKLKVVATIFPAYDFARQVCGDTAEVTMLLPPGSESHSYEPTPQDIIKIQNCDLFIYTGGESDTWVDGILSSLPKPIKTVKMMASADVVEELLTKGMEAEDQEEGHEGEPEYDEHVWTSPVNAKKIVSGITDALCAIDAKNAVTYRKNSDAYQEKLTTLDQEFRDFFATCKNKTFVVGDRFPLRYFTETYGLDPYAAFPGCSSETEPSAATIAFLIDKVKTEKVPTVFYIEFSNHHVADSIAESAGVKTALFHTCHNVSAEDLKNGATYLSLMQQNLSTLKGAMK